ncbi:hypothetical protein Q0P29_14270, partial [Staphylococcus aureus]|nr:hypothetical protein [Staphylococcus aureus]
FGALLVTGVTVGMFIAVWNAPPANSQGMSEMNHSMPGMNMGASPQNAIPEISALPESPLSTVTRMGNLVMPPGMIMTPDQSMEAM